MHQDSTTPLGDVVAGQSETPQENLVAQFTATLATLNLQDDQPAMHSMLKQLTSGLATMSLAQEQLSQKQKALVESDRKSKVEAAVRGVTNPMSIRNIRLNYRVLHLIDDLLEVFCPDGAQYVATNLTDVNDLIQAATTVLFEISRILKTENEKHVVAQSSHLGWRVVKELDKKDPDHDEMEESKLVSEAAVVQAERQFMSYQLDMQKTLNFTKAGHGGRGGGQRVAPRRGGSSGSARGGKGRTSLKSMGLDTSKAGRVSKPRYGGCHRCGGPHFVRSCPKPLAKD